MDVLRVFVGGLPRHIEPEELTSRFIKFGKVLDVEVKNKLDATGEWLKTFGYLNLETTQQSFQKCRSQLNNSTWRDGRLTIQLAKQDISVRYAEERKQRAAEPQLTKSAQSEMTSQQQLSVIPREMKGAVPGTHVPDTEDWVVTKFQRVVPIMNVRSKDKKKVVRYDPSKHCHQIKRLDAEKKNSSTEEVAQQQSVSELTWSLDDPVLNGNSGNTENQIKYRKRIGDYSGLPLPAKKKKSKRSAPEVIQQEKEKRAQLLAEAILNDDMEVVSSGQTLTTSKPNTPVSGDSGVVQSNIDLSRFDSDCDDSDEPDSSVTPKATNKVSTYKESLVDNEAKPQKANQKSASSVVVKKIAKVTSKSKTNKSPSSSSSDSSDSESSDDEKPATVAAAPKRTRTPFRGTVSSDSVKKDPVFKKPEGAQMNTKEATKKNKNTSDSSSSDSTSSDSSSSESESSDSDTTTAKIKSAAKTKPGAKLPKESPAVAFLQAPVKPSALKSKTNTVNAVKNRSEESSSDSSSSDSEGSDKETTRAKTSSVNTQKPPKKTAAVTPLPVTAKPDKRTESLKPGNKPDAMTPAATPGQDNLAAILSNAANSMKSGNMTEQFALLLETAAQIIKSAGQPSNVNTEKSLASSMSLAESKPDMVLQPKTLDYSDNDNSVPSSPSKKAKGDKDRQSAITSTEHRKPGEDSSSSADSSDSDNSISDKTKPLLKSSTRKSNKSTNIEPSHDQNVTAAKVNGTASNKSSSSMDSELSSSDSDGEKKKQPHKTSQTENSVSKAQVQKNASKIIEKRSSSEDSSESETDTEKKPTDKYKTSPAQVENESSSSSSSESESDSDSDSSGDDKPTVQSKAPARKAPSATHSVNKQSVNKGAKKEKVLTQGEKRALANQKRLEAMSNKQKELSTQQKAIQQSLKNLDTPANNKKVVFGSDSESEEADGDKSKESATADQQKTLFDGSSDEEGGDDYDKMFAIKPQFEGEKGAKLLSLQKTFSDDSRFKLTEKFLESDHSDEESKVKNKDSHVADAETEEVDGAAERRRNLEILQSIVGSRNVKIDHPTATKTKKIADTPATVFRDISSMQFDPTSEANDNLIKKIAPSEPKPKKKKKKQEGSEPVVGSEPAPEITKDRFFEVAADFTQKTDTTGDDTTTNTVTNDSGTGGMVFNFLGDETKSSSESESSDAEEKTESDEDMDTEEKGQEAGYTNRKFTNPFDVDNGGKRFDDESDSDNEAGGDKAEDDEQSGKKETKAPTPVLPNTVVDWFFFKPTDPRLAEGSKRFSRTLDNTQIKKQWEQVRPKLVESYMTKSKRAALKLRKRKTSIVKKRLEAKATRKGKGPTRGRR